MFDPADHRIIQSFDLSELMLRGRENMPGWAKVMYEFMNVVLPTSGMLLSPIQRTPDKCFFSCGCQLYGHILHSKVEIIQTHER
jgi:hypothetical protein